MAGDGSPLLLAVSGGPDSTALMHAAASWPDAPPLLVATVDHGLRPESRAEAEGVAAQAAMLGLPHVVLAWGDPPPRVSQRAAREARYRLLAEHAAAIGAVRVATAHTLDDQVETVLMRLAAGSGLSGLGGMEPVSQRGTLRHLRPFLGFRKVELVATCRARGWSFVEDPTNRDPRYARPRWRALAGLLATEGLTPERVATLGDRLRRADAALDAAATLAAAQAIEIVEEGAAPPSPRGAVGRAPSLRRSEPGWGASTRSPGGREVDTSPQPGPPLRSGSALPTASGGRVALVNAARLEKEPEEIALRVLLRALEAVSAETIRLDRAETALAALLAAHRERRPLRRTLAGLLLMLTEDGILRIAPEPPRFRGR